MVLTVGSLKERWNVSLSAENVMLGVAIAALIVISFTGSYTHIVDLAQKHNQHGIEARATAAVVDILCYVFAAERQRDKRIGRKKRWGIVTFPTLGLIVGVSASLAMNLALAGSGPWGYTIAAIPCAALLLVITLLERRTTFTSKIAGPVPAAGPEVSQDQQDRAQDQAPQDQVDDQDQAAQDQPVPVMPAARPASRTTVVAERPETPAVERPAQGPMRSMDHLKHEALAAVRQHRVAHGRRMNNKELARALRVSNELAGEVRRQIKDQEEAA